MPESILSTLALLAGLQRERGQALRAIPIGTLEALAGFEMQSTMTSLAFEKAQKNMPDIETLLPRRFFEALKLRNNESFRASQPLLSLDEWYSFNLEHPIQQLALTLIAENPHFSPAQASALSHMLTAIGSLCSVRDTGLILYARAEVTSEDIGKMKAFALACLTRERLFLGLADENAKKIYDETRATTSTSLNDTDDILARIKAGLAKGLLAETPLPLWFERLDTEIALRHETLRTMIVRLDQEGHELAELNAPGQALDADIEAALDEIDDLPLFRGLSESALRSVLKGARLTEHEKNTVLLTQDEPTSRFFIVLDGWIKLYKTTADGEDSVLQILGKKECLLDNAYAPSGLSCLCAKTVTKARILSLSLPAIRDMVSRNHELAQNLLAATTTRLQKSVAQFEQITLHTAEQRVGWFLVNLHLGNGLEGAPLQLPYDKALIANFLNIKPETFSRVMQSFRKRGFKIDKHQIVMPHRQALCEYCDPDMAVRCCRAEALNCGPIKAARRGAGKA